MPPASKPAELLQAQITGTTKTTRVLDALFQAKDPTVIQALRTQPPIVGLPPWLVTVLQLPGLTDPGLVLSQAELDHIGDWPDGQKALVRATFLNAVDEDGNLRFFWKLGGTPRESTEITDQGTGDIVVTFRSPDNRVRQRNADDVHVDVGPNDAH